MHSSLGNKSETPSKKKKKPSDKLKVIKIRNFCSSKDAVKRIKTQVTNCEYLFANDVTDKGFVFSIRKPSKLNLKNTLFFF